MILVTGAAGRLGNRVVQRLVDEGREVVGSDRRPCPENFPTTFIETDLCDHTSAWHVSDGADAVVHMGAIPGPGADPDETFHNNMMSTFHVMRAAQEHGTRRIVFSSSAFGMGWAHDPAAFVPDYLPLDEDHLMMPFEPYGLTKQLGGHWRDGGTQFGNHGGEPAFHERRVTGTSTGGVPLGSTDETESTDPRDVGLCGPT